MKYTWLHIAGAAVAAAVLTFSTDISIAQQRGGAGGGRGNGGDSAAPARKQGDGQGPFKKMVIRSVTMIDGTGGPPISPMDIVIEGNRITQIRQAGWPGLPQQPNREPRDFDFEIDGRGMYVMPGFVDMHVHGAGKDKAPDLSYNYKLWLAHGVTTVRGVSLSSAALSSSEKDRSARNEIVAGVGLVLSTSISCPAPPRNAPFAATSCRNRRKCTFSGASCSMTSTGVEEMLLGHDSTLRPSACALAP